MKMLLVKLILLGTLALMARDLLPRSVLDDLYEAIPAAVEVALDAAHLRPADMFDDLAARVRDTFGR